MYEIAFLSTLHKYFITFYLYDTLSFSSHPHQKEKEYVDETFDSHGLYEN